MSKKTVLAAVGADQPGVVATLCSVLTETSCNIAQMTQSNLSHQFASLFIIEKPEALPNATLQEKLQRACHEAGLKITVNVYDMNESQKDSTQAAEPFVISIFGGDRNDIIGTFAKIFGNHNINIEDLRALQAGHSDFMTVYEVLIPVSTDIKALHKTLIAQAQSMGLQLTLQHRNIFEAIHRVQIF